MGMMGSLGSTSPMRPAGVPQQLRPVASSLRPQTSIGSQSATTQVSISLQDRNISLYALFYNLDVYVQIVLVDHYSHGFWL